MISDPDAARRVSALMLEIGAKLDASTADVQASCPLPEFERYVEAFDVAAMWLSNHKQSEVFRRRKSRYQIYGAALCASIFHK
jgi:hypothetical protein